MSYYDNFSRLTQGNNEKTDFMNEFNTKKSNQSDQGHIQNPINSAYAAPTNVPVQYLMNQPSQGMYYSVAPQESNNFEAHAQMVNQMLIDQAKMGIHVSSEQVMPQSFNSQVSLTVPQFSNVSEMPRKTTPQFIQPRAFNTQQGNYSLQEHNWTPLTDILKEAFMCSSHANQGTSLICQNLIRSFLTHRMDAESFISMMAVRKYFVFSAEQGLVLREYTKKLNESGNIEMLSSSALKSFQTNPNQTNQAQSHVPNVRIPQLTFVQNNSTRPALFNLPSSHSNTLRLSQVVRQQPNSNYLKQLSDIHEAKLASLPKTAEQMEGGQHKEQVEEEIEMNFDIGGVNIQEEENILGKTEISSLSKPCIQSLAFNPVKIKSIITQICL
ncbi:hypothetical protein MXB_16 [Myxobolus squamalis]|nr:hypothetical protein MXB_16 [Myxobolus squamalis]